MPKKTYLIVALLLVAATLFAQPKKYSAADIHQKIRKLNVLGSVLYVAAHPDDENTSVISYYANEELFRTAYLSATRGDGGQNLVGPEIREGLGIIRTQELLAARRTDGGEQFFSRANDFGYSKNPEETFKMWDKQEILSDFVWIFRKFRPDVIITRFDDKPPNHGHHTASAILAREAFKLSGDKSAFPEQLEHVEVWQPERIYWNTHPFFFTRRGEKFDTANYGQVSIGEFNPVLGKSYTEMSALSRSMHKSQGFGSMGSRGERTDYLTQWEGSESLQPFDAIDTSWERVKGGKKVKMIANGLMEKFDPTDPSTMIDDLLKMRKAIEENVKDDFWKKIKLKEVDELLVAVSGTYVEIKANDYSFVPGDSVELTLEAINRSEANVRLTGLTIDGLYFSTDLDQSLKANQRFNKTMNAYLTVDAKTTEPYWLSEPGTLGRYKVADQMIRGKPENDAAFQANVSVSFNNEEIQLEIPVVYKRTDPVDGEVYRPIVVQPPVSLNIESSSMIFSSDDPRTIQVRAIAGRKDVTAGLRLKVPEGWKVEPAFHTVVMKQKNEEKTFDFTLTPPPGKSQGLVVAEAEMAGREYSRGLEIIEYDHIPTQTVFPESSIKVARVDLEKMGEEIGYIMGAGDDIPASLEQIGYKVTLLEKDDVTPENLAKFQAVILGIRALNTVDWLAFKNEDLLKYVQNGGNLIVQYNTNRRMVTDKFAPYDITVSRDRVAVEEAEVRFLAPEHRVLNYPNKITKEDFDGWVQERGLYFPNKWADEYTAILSSNDPDEPARDGGLLVAKYGKGYYVYSGYSWFRELPAGVTGAYRLFTNLISLGDDRINN